MGRSVRMIAVAAGLWAWAWMGLFGAGPAQAAVYVVDQNHPAAGDENPGTEAKPWKTVQAAARAAKAGDTVCVMEGDYRERVRMESSGAEGRPIVFRAVPRQAAVVEGFDTGNQSHLRIEGFRVTHDKPSTQTPAIVLGGGGSHIEILDNRIEGIYMGLSGGAKHVRVAFNKIYRTQYGLLTGSGSEAWVIESNDLERQFQHRAGDCDYSRMWGKNHLVRYNRYHGTIRAEVGKAHLDCVQSFNVKKDNPGMFLHHLTFEHNVCSSFSQAFMISTSTPGTHHHYTFRHNIFWSGGAWGLCLSRMPDMAAENNTFATIKWYGFGNQGGENGRAVNNLFFGINTPYTTGPGFVGRRNLVFNCERNPKEAADEWLSGDPRFADVEKGNLRLTAGSAAIDAGTDGKDIGALEYPNVYYVDPRHPGASDEGFGYAGWPFKTVARACSVAGPGETIVLRGGAYRETIVPGNDGTTVRAMAGEKVVVSGADLVGGWTREGDAWAAPLDAEPTRLLRDGRPWTEYTWDGSARRLIVRTGGDPRLHEFETVTRRHAIDVSRTPAVKLEGLETANTLAEGILRATDRR